MFKPFIYALVDPFDPDHVRYVGMAYCNAVRPYDHARNARKFTNKHSHLFHWIRSLQAEGRDPAVLVLEEVSEGFSRDLLGFIESCYIKSLREIGHSLTNVMPGGEGAHGPRTEETKRKIREWWTPERRAEKALSVTGTVRSLESLMQAAEKNRGRKRSPESCERIAASLRGKKRSLESRARQSASRMGRTNTPESNQKRSATQSGRKDPLEVCARKSAAAVLREEKRKALTLAQRTQLSLERAERKLAQLRAAQC